MHSRALQGYIDKLRALNNAIVIFITKNKLKYDPIQEIPITWQETALTAIQASPNSAPQSIWISQIHP